MKKLLLTLIFISLSIIFTQAAFNDVTSDYIYKVGIDYVQAQGIVDGYSDGTFRPGNSITRGEFTKILIGASIEGQLSGSCIGAGGGPSFPDVISSNTFYTDICYAQQFGYISGYSDGTFRPDNYITVGEASKIIVNALEIESQQSSSVGDNDKFLDYLNALINKMALPKEITYQGDPLTRGQMAEVIYRIKNNIMVPSKSVGNYNDIRLSHEVSNRNDFRSEIGYEVYSIVDEVNPSSLYVHESSVQFLSGDAILDELVINSFTAISVKTENNICNALNAEETDSNRIVIYYDPMNVKVCVPYEGTTSSFIAGV